MGKRDKPERPYQADHKVIGFFRMTFHKVMAEHFPDSDPILLEKIFDYLESKGLTFWMFIKPLVEDYFEKKGEAIHKEGTLNDYLDISNQLSCIQAELNRKIAKLIE